MALLRRVLETALYCDDLQRTTAFYERMLGATPMLRTDRVVAFDAGEGTVLLLFRRGHSHPLQTDGGLVPGHDGSGPAHLAFAIAGTRPQDGSYTSLRWALRSRVA
jgi:catechol 2,3-dioxygenase-like lactoylglutathione lyase family enzyme